MTVSNINFVRLKTGSGKGSFKSSSAFFYFRQYFQIFFFESWLKFSHSVVNLHKHLTDHFMTVLSLNLPWPHQNLNKIGSGSNSAKNLINYISFKISHIQPFLKLSQLNE